MSGNTSRRALLAGGAAGAALSVLPRAHAQAAWPSQPIRLVVPFAPGGTTDLAARLVAQGMQERLGQPFIIENRAGAGATVGSQMVATAAPDGYTLVMSNIASHGIAPALYGNLRYDALRDFVHIGLVVANPSIFVANPRFAARTMPEMVALSKREPRGLDIATSGSGSSNHLLVVQVAQETGANLNHVPYRGAGPAMTDTIAGVVPMMSDSLPSATSHLRAGSVRGLAMASESRHPAFPDIPTFREQGVDLVSTSWFGLSAPAGTPAAIAARISQELRAVLSQPAVQARFAELGGTVGDLSPEGYTDFVRAEVTRWAPVVKASGATVE